MAIHPGQTLAGYSVLSLLGRGGMGEVWAARSEDGSREVAIKVLLPTAALKPDIVARFEREAQVTASIQSDYVCKLLSFERNATGSLLLVFEKLEGESLSERLKRDLYMSFTELGPLLDDVLQGLVAAHEAGVIHRDLKPGNIFIETTGDPQRPERAKILDFGISKLSKKSGDEQSLTDFDATLGSFPYMPPERVRGAARVDVRCDIYATAAVAFRALAARLPFEGTNAGQIIALKLDREAPSLQDITGEKWPAGLERFLASALNRDPEKRPTSALEALESWRAIQPEAITARASQVPPLAAASERIGQFDGQPTMTDISSHSYWDEPNSSQPPSQDGND